MSAEVLVTVEDGIQTITINRPEARNAMTLAAAQLIVAALDDLDRRDDLRIGILTGAGGTFCAGMDLKGFLRGERPSIPGRGFGGLTLQPPRKPLIAAVEGFETRVWVQGDPAKGTMKSAPIPQAVIERLSQG